MKKFLIIFALLFLNLEISYADFKKIKKTATVTQPEVIFPIPKNLEKCITNMYVNKGNKCSCYALHSRMHKIKILFSF